MKRSVLTATTLILSFSLLLASCSILPERSHRSNRDDDEEEEEEEEETSRLDEYLEFCEDDLDCEILSQREYADIMSGRASDDDISNGMAAILDGDTAMELIFHDGDVTDRPVPGSFEEAACYCKVTDDGYGMMTATLLEFEDEDEAMGYIETASDFYAERGDNAFNCTFVDEDDKVVSTSMPYGNSYSEIAFYADDNYVYMVANAYSGNTFYEFEETDDLADFLGFDAPSSLH
ncbi:MAG: hypothetical protein K5745_05075 [Saccharofermentans sp.]|nr:hypothetical protein [Saccharofermentans sp.]